MVEEILKRLPLYENRRSEISGFGANFGVVISAASHKPVIHSATFSHKDDLHELFSLLRWLGVLPNSFECTSFQVLHNASVRKHRDANTGPSLVFATGDFTGGRLIADGEVIPNFRQGAVFDGQREHYVE